MAIDKKALSEADIRTKYITPAIEQAGWDKMSQMREEYSITAGCIIARGQVCKREEPLKADYVLFYKPSGRSFQIIPRRFTILSPTSRTPPIWAGSPLTH